MTNVVLPILAISMHLKISKYASTPVVLEHNYSCFDGYPSGVRHYELDCPVLVYCNFLCDLSRNATTHFTHTHTWLIGVVYPHVFS